MMLSVLWKRALVSLTTVPPTWYPIVGITAISTAMAGGVAATTGFVDLANDWNPPHHNTPWWKPCTAFVFPALVEEVIWRGALLPSPPTSTSPSAFASVAAVVCVLHVTSHVVAGHTVWPRGRDVFDDPRFLACATIVLGGSTVSYYVSGGSVWAATLTHGTAVALWRDFYGGERRLGLKSNNKHKSTVVQVDQ